MMETELSGSLAGCNSVLLQGVWAGAPLALDVSACSEQARALILGLGVVGLGLSPLRSVCVPCVAGLLAGQSRGWHSGLGRKIWGQVPACHNSCVRLQARVTLQYVETWIWTWPSACYCGAINKGSPRLFMTLARLVFCWVLLRNGCIDPV